MRGIIGVFPFSRTRIVNCEYLYIKGLSNLFGFEFVMER